MTMEHDNPAINLLESLTTAIQKYEDAQSSLADAIIAGIAADLPGKYILPLMTAGEGVNKALANVTGVTERILAMAIGLNPDLVSSLQRVSDEHPDADKALLSKLLREAEDVRPEMIKVLRKHLESDDIDDAERERLEKHILTLSEHSR